MAGMVPPPWHVNSRPTEGDDEEERSRQLSALSQDLICNPSMGLHNALTQLQHQTPMAPSQHMQQHQQSSLAPLQLSLQQSVLQRLQQPPSLLANPFAVPHAHLTDHGRLGGLGAALLPDQFGRSPLSLSILAELEQRAAHRALAERLQSYAQVNQGLRPDLDQIVVPVQPAILAPAPLLVPLERGKSPSDQRAPSKPDPAKAKKEDLPSAFPSERRALDLKTECSTRAEATGTLKALGTTLRSKADKFIDAAAIGDPGEPVSTTKGRGQNEFFPDVLYRMLEDTDREGLTDVISWLPHGRAFRVHKREKFETDVLPRYYTTQSKWSSFSRQLNM